jgi:hypothetical protein
MTKEPSPVSFLGLGKSQTYDDVDRVRALAAKLYRKMMDD